MPGRVMATSATGRPPAFILGLGPNGYGHARNLVRAGVPVLGFHYSEQHFGRDSRLIRTFPLERHQSSEAIADVLIERAASVGHRPPLVAASDEFAFLFAQRQDRLAGHFVFHWNSPETSNLIYDKPRMIRFCEEAGIRTPKTHATEIGEDVAAAASNFSFPCIVKPIRSFHTAFPPGQKNYV